MKRGLFRSMSPWDGPFPKLRGSLEVSFILPVPLGSLNIMVLPKALQYLGVIRRFLTENYPGRHEILLAPFGVQRRFRVGKSSLRRWKPYALFDRKWVVSSGIGEAVRRAVMHSRGRNLLVGNAEYLFPPSFYQDALQALARGAQAVRVNRRLPESKLMVPTPLMPLAYLLHLWGSLFNRITRLLLPLKTSDGLSGAYALPRHLALRFFNRLTCPGFLYEVELDLIATSNGGSWEERPSFFHFEREKSAWRILRETAEIATWLPRFVRHFRRGSYEFLKKNGNHLFADDWGLSPGVNAGILRIARLGHLRHVSIMAGSRYARLGLRQLRRIRGMELGLHLSLTTPPSSPGKVLKSWLLWRLTGSRSFVKFCRRELLRQIHWVKQHRIPPLYLDGHHHVHALPGVLDLVADILKKEGIRYVRVPCDRSFSAGLKVIVIYLMGRLLAGSVRRHGFRYLPFRYLLPRDCATSNDLVRRLNHTFRSEVLTHPAAYDDIQDAAPFDSYRQERVVEYNALRMLALGLKLDRPFSRRSKVESILD